MMKETVEIDRVSNSPGYILRGYQLSSPPRPSSNIASTYASASTSVMLPAPDVLIHHAMAARTSLGMALDDLSVRIMLHMVRLVYIRYADHLIWQARALLAQCTNSSKSQLTRKRRHGLGG